MKLRLALFLIGLAFAVTLAIVIGTRLSDQAMFVIVGVAAGVAASIPASLIVLWLAVRHLAAPAPRAEAARAPEAEPRVIVVQAPAAMPQPAPEARYPALPAHVEPQAARRYTIIGGETASID
jgi:hypothetical protein